VCVHSLRNPQVSVYLFSIAVIGLSIPVYSVMVKYNLYVSRVFSGRWSAFWGVVFPWIVSFPLYQGSGFLEFLTWSSLIVNGALNFLLPIVVYITAMRRKHHLDARMNLTTKLLTSVSGEENPAESEPLAKSQRTGIFTFYSRQYAAAIVCGFVVVILLVLAFVLQVIQETKTAADGGDSTCQQWISR